MPAREGIAAARALCDELAAADAAVRAIKGEASKIKEKKLKERVRRNPQYRGRLAEAERRFRAIKGEFLPACRVHWRGPHLAWMDAALTLDADGQAAYPALLGTGGNDGRLDFTNNAMARLGDLFDLAAEEGNARTAAGPWLRQAMFGDGTPDLLQGAAVGQFLPGGAGGANSATGPDGEGVTNPWDFILMLEGAVLFAAHSARRFGTRELALTSAPFGVRAHATGSGSVSAADESARGEQWMPLWDRPMTLGELKRLLAEGRAQIGTRPAMRPLDLARAVARLGVARGLTGFQRYGYLERNGQSNLAVPLGRVAVSLRPRARLVDDLDGWLDRLHRASRAKGAPARLQTVERQVADAVFEALTHDDSVGRWQAVLIALAAVEVVQATGTGLIAGPIPRLRVDWVAAADDGSPEFRLALALAGASGDWSRDGRLLDPVRHHFLPLKQGARAFATQGNGLAHDVRVVARGRDPVSDLLAVVDRRLTEAEQHGNRRLALRAASGTAVRPADLSTLLAGKVDLARCVTLARALMALDWPAWQSDCHQRVGPSIPDQAVPDDPWLVLRLALLPWPLDGERDIPADPAIVRRLAAGDAATAVDLALRRLRARGLRPTVTAGTTNAARARLWGAVLAFPISQRTAQAFARRIHPISQGA